MIERLFNRQKQETEEHWVSISDVMAGLMVIFLFIAISYMVNANQKNEQLIKINEQLIKIKDEVEDLLDVYTNLQRALSEDLQKEFEGDPEWTGTLDPETLSIRFKEPFTQDDATVPNDFKKVLNDFFPRYIEILTKSEYKNDIAEIRIEGHTSSEWHHEATLDEAYFNNMELSQNRSRNVLRYVLGIKDQEIIQNKRWIKENMTANGLSSSQTLPVSPEDPLVENKEESRRVEFRVVTKLEKLIDKIKEIMRASEKEGEVK